MYRSFESHYRPLSLVSLPPNAIFKPHHIQWQWSNTGGATGISGQIQGRGCQNVFRYVFETIYKIGSSIHALLLQTQPKTQQMKCQYQSILQGFYFIWGRPRAQTWLALIEQMMSRHWLSLGHTREVWRCEAINLIIRFPGQKVLLWKGVKAHYHGE